MEIRIGFDLMCECPAPTAMVLMLGTHPERARDIVAGEHFRLSSLEPVGRYLDSFGNVCARVVAPSGQSTFRGHAVARDHGEPDPVDTSAEEVPIARLPDDVMLYLMGSAIAKPTSLWVSPGRRSAISRRGGAGCRRSSTLFTGTSNSTTGWRGRPGRR